MGIQWVDRGRGVCFPGQTDELRRKPGADGSLAFSVDVAADGIASDWCELLTDGKVTHSSAGSSTSRDDGAATSAGLVAHLQIVTAASGTPTVTIQQSSDNGVSDAWATLASFTAVGYAWTP